LSERIGLFFSAGTEEFKPKFKGEEGKIESFGASIGFMASF